MPTEDEAPVPSPEEFDRLMNEKIWRRARQADGPCPRCHGIGYRRVADSEFVALYACRLCGYQHQEPHEPGVPSGPVFREYREGRPLSDLLGDPGTGVSEEPAP